jgi:hypothetical protein
MAENESDHKIHKHDLIFETFQPGWDKRSVATVTSQIGHAHKGNTPDHYHQVQPSEPR